MRPHPVLLLLPLLVGTGAEGEVRLGCGFGDGLGIVDADGDGYGSTIDCDDGDAAVHPDAEESCNGIDDDCDDELDEDHAIDASTWHFDGDHDGWGVLGTESVRACTQPDGYGPAGDCYDMDPRISPDAEESCNGLDDDCDGELDEDAVDASWGCRDQDRDGFGDPEVCLTSCDLPPSFVADDGDCDDEDPAVHPEAEEICNGIDDDCDERIDPQAGDADGDGWDGCEGDCAPEDPAVHPGAEEICGNGLDDDCDGSAGDCGLEGSFSLGGAGLLLTGPAAYQAAGKALCGVGDLDADGLADFVVAAPWAEGAASDHGAVYLMHGDPALRSSEELGLSQASVILRGQGRDDMLGWAVSGAGDVDADGLADLLVGAPYDAWPGFPAGAAYLIPGAALRGLEGELELEALGVRLALSAYEDRLGWSVAGPGDVDGDGFDDVLVGAPQANGEGPDSGVAYLVRGPLGDQPQLELADASWSTDSLEDGVGYALAGAGDLDGDGLADLAIGAYRWESERRDEGMVAVVLGGKELGGSGSLVDADALLIGSQERSFAGCAVAGVGDADGDGLSDLLVGAQGQDGGLVDAGAAFLVLGPVHGALRLDVVAAAVLWGEESYGYAGYAVAGPGDLDGDGLADLAVGAPYFGDNHGLAALFVGSPRGAHGLSSAAASFSGGGSGRSLGERLAGAGDVDGDGWPDLLVGVPGYELPGADAGAAWLLWGGEGL